MMLFQVVAWLRGGSSRGGLPGRGLGRFDYFEDFSTDPLEHPKHGTHDPVWLTNTDNVLVSEGAGAGAQQRGRMGPRAQPPRAAAPTLHSRTKDDEVCSGLYIIAVD